MNLFALTIGVMALLPLCGHLFCLWSLRRDDRSPGKTAASAGLFLGLAIVAANLAQLAIWNLPPDQRGPWSALLIPLPVAALIASVVAIRLMRRSRILDMQSIGITAVVVSLLSMASVLALGSLTIAG